MGRMSSKLDPEHASQASAAIEVLASSELQEICEMVIWRGDAETYHARNARGSVAFRRFAENGGYSYEILKVEGENPLALQDVAAFSPLETEVANLYPAGDNHFPHAFESIAQAFDDYNSPDMAAVHTAAHNWEDEGGHRGEHGSLDVVQSRAPFIASGKGIKKLGLIDQSAQVIDIAPTIMALLGAPTLAGKGITGEQQPGLFLTHQDGKPISGLLDSGERPEHVVAFLLDGCNANVLYDMAAGGEIPNIARLLDEGTGLRHGLFSGFPSVTLANHTSAVTGVLPGHHRILHNSFWDRDAGARIDTNHPSTWHLWAQWASPDVETVHQAIHRIWPDAFTASVNEPADRGADFSTFELFRKGRGPDWPDNPVELPSATEQFVRPYKDYELFTAVDHMGVEQAVAIWEGQYRGVDYGQPKFMWCNLALTDAAMHRGGPHSEIARAGVRDTDGRIGKILEAIEAAGALESTAFILLADHGMEESNPEVTGNWAHHLRAEGITFRDEGYGFIYIGVKAEG